jgi:hypothetical protein
MQLIDRDIPGPKRDFIGYGRRLPKVVWPDGAKVAVNLVVNYGGSCGSLMNTISGSRSLPALSHWNATRKWGTGFRNVGTSPARMAGGGVNSGGARARRKNSTCNGRSP